MTLSKLHAKLEEDKKKLDPVDGRRFNSRSRQKMEREIRVIRKSTRRLRRKSTATKHLHRGLFSKEEVDFANEEKRKFREEMSLKKSSSQSEDEATNTSVTTRA